MRFLHSVSCLFKVHNNLVCEFMFFLGITRFPYEMSCSVSLKELFVYVIL
jgi:hypothetical protein